MGFRWDVFRERECRPSMTGDTACAVRLQFWWPLRQAGLWRLGCRGHFGRAGA